ncbi:MAG: helix-hairpin-helix domain-containing protein [Deltaproteobacteria bacterium]|nr:helix-hairpin-helix domain-containing protein [Deltaproteobacteria bacterium]
MALTVAGLKIGSSSQAVLQPLAAVSDPAARAAVEDAVRRASAVDGDRVLDAFEAQALRAAYDAVVPSGGTLDVANAAAFTSAVSARIDALTAARPRSTDVVFTSEGNALVVFRQKILGAIDETLARAGGKSVDVNLLLFAFTDKVLADAIADRCRNHANLTVRLLTDWSQLPTSGDRQPARLALLGLPNLVVKFKKDSPYVWGGNGPDYNHGATQGLNHHKGFVTLIDGRPEKMTAGSFNWSVGAMDGNYENLMVLDRHDVDNRAVMTSYQKEFEGFWNEDRAALTHAEALRERERLYAELARANNASYTPNPVTVADIPDPVYQAQDRSSAVDVNSFGDRDVAALKALIGSTRVNKVLAELRDFGRFDTVDELFERVPALATLSAAKQAELRARAELGEGALSVNSASVAELDRAGFSKKQAEKIVAYLQTYGAVEDLAELQAAAGLSNARLARILPSLSGNEVKALYSARVPGGAASTGWSTEHQGTTQVARKPGAATTTAPSAPARPAAEQVARDLASAVADLLRRAPAGETFKLAMYGISPGSPEFQELVDAVNRGVKLRAVLYDQYNQPAIDALKALKAQGKDVELRIISARVMHEKFGVIGDDVFNGSANFSSSSITKHTEDRFLFRNMPALAKRFADEFDRLWSRGTPP